MSLVAIIVAKFRARRAAKVLARDPSARNYTALAKEYVIAGNAEEVLRVCTEALELHPDDTDLRNLAARAKTLQLDRRLRALQSQAEVSPRPAVLRELCGVLIESGKLDRAEKIASRWYKDTQDPEARLYRARVHAERFFEERCSRDGAKAFELAAKAFEGMQSDSRPLVVQYQVASRSGAWAEARGALSKLLELKPGDPALEANFRYVLAMCETEKDRLKSLSQALQKVERTGRFADDEPEPSEEQAVSKVAVRPMLKEISEDSEVKAAVYLRGQTALVQGLRGATAERTSRTIREVVQATRGATRRLGLGQPTEVLIEGSFGALLVSAGERSSSAIWCADGVKRQHRAMLKNLSGMAGMTGGAMV